MQPVDVIIGIGHDGSPSPHLVAPSVRAIVSAHGGRVNASIVGTSRDDTWGDEPASWWAVTLPSINAWFLARQGLLALAADHGQQALAFTVGTTEVVETTRAVAS